MHIIYLTALAIALATQARPPTAPQAASQNLPPMNLCDTPGHHQFDFWLGKWKVYRADNNRLVADSLIEKLYNGCAVRENWMPLHGFGGGSLNSYEPKLNRWRQFWTDSGNEVHDYSGSWDGKRLVMAGRSVDPAGKIQRLRMTYERLASGDVVQTGYMSSDGKNWALDYKLLYRHDAQLEKSDASKESTAGHSN